MENEFDARKYFNYYINHTHNVVLAWLDIREVLLENNIITEAEFAKINKLIAWHDNSKIAKEEFIGYGLKFFGTVEDLKTNELFKKAWEHHKKNNLHHHQSLKNYTGNDRKCYIIEMLCDWIAMGWDSGSLAQDYYFENKEKIDLLNSDYLLIEEIFKLIKENNCFSDHKITSKEKTKLIFF